MENFNYRFINSRKTNDKRMKAQLRIGLPLRGRVFLSGFGLKLLCGFLLIFAGPAAFSCPAYVFRNGKLVEYISVKPAKTAYVFRDGKFVKEKTGGDVFIRFAETHIGENWAEVMDSQITARKRTGWKTAILSSTRRWSPAQAEEFLNIFQERLGAHGALRLTARSFSYLESLIPAKAHSTGPVFQALKDRMDYYDSYLGEEKTTELLFNSLDGFTDRDIDRTRELTRFLESYYGSKETVAQIMERNIGAYSKTGREDIEPVMLFLDRRLGRPAVIEITLRDRREKRGYLSLSKLKDLQKTVRPLIDTAPSLSPESDKAVREGLSALIELHGRSLAGSRKMMQFLKTQFGENLPAEIMSEDLKSFADVPWWMDFGEERAKIFDKYFKDRQTAAAFIRIHYKKLFSDSRWEKFVENASKFFPKPPWNNTWD